MTIHSNPLGKNLAIQFKIIENVFEGMDRFKSELILRNNSDQIMHNNWSIYFNFLRMILPESVGEGYQIHHINGDFFCLEPKIDTKPLLPNSEIAIPFVSNNWAIKAIDMPVGFYIVYRDDHKNELEAQSIDNLNCAPFTNLAQVVRNENDHLPVPTANSRFEDYKNLTLLDKKDLPPIIPTPVFLQKEEGKFQIKPSFQIGYAPHLKAEAEYLSEMLEPYLGSYLPIVEGNIGEITLDTGHIEIKNTINKSGSGAYSLHINTNGIAIIGTEAAGTFYGIQSLNMLLKNVDNTLELPNLEIKDIAKFKYRGMHLDVGRNFHKKETINKLIDMMALYKLNKFHFHLTDDEGWRIEIKGLPELTEIGGRRGHTYDEKNCLLPSYGSGHNPNDPNSSGNGFYSGEDFVELLRYAHSRHIEVIPAIDFPGHARAAVRAMEVRYERYRDLGDLAAANEYLLTDWEDASDYESVQMWRRNVVNMGLESTYHFIEKVVDEVMDLYKKANVKLSAIHIGGDEVPGGVWTKSPACERLKAKEPKLKTIQDLFDYFIKRVNHILEIRNMLTAGWEEIALAHKEGKIKPNLGLLEHKLMPYVWNTIWGGGGEEVAYDLANNGFKVVLANATSLYFDFAYDKDPEEAGYYWGGYINTEQTYKFLPFDLYQSAGKDVFGNLIDKDNKYKNALKLTKEGEKNILGLQGQLWSETIRNSERIDYLLFPRMIALAEKAWAEDPLWMEIEEPIRRQNTYNTAWNQFANQIGQIELPRLDGFLNGIAYRIPMPGAKIENGLLFANIEFPGLTIRYTIDGSEPTENDLPYKMPVLGDSKIIKLKAFTTTNRSSRTTILNLENDHESIYGNRVWEERFKQIEMKKNMNS